MILLVGLGNPGARHAGNRHNVGFMAVDAIAAANGLPAPKRRFQGLLAEGRIAGARVGLLKPQTYMNNSGQCVGEAMRFYKLSPEDVIVFHDELDLAPGKLRIKAGGGSAGHNGLRSLISHIGAGFRRVRIGIGHPGDRRRVETYVLKDFTRTERTWLETLLEAIGTQAELLVTGRDDAFMNKVALATQGKPDSAPAAAAKPARRQARPVRRKGTPSQHDLARAAAGRDEARAARSDPDRRRGKAGPGNGKKPAADAEPSGPFAQLRRWLGENRK